MTREIPVFQGVWSPTFSVNKIAEAIVKTHERIRLLETTEFGGELSAAFREGLVREYNAKMANCPKCGGALIRTDEGKGDCRNCKTLFEFPKENAHLCYVIESAIADFVAKRIGNGFAHRTGDYYHLGEVRGRTLYYGTDPSKCFYSAHKGNDVAIVLGRNTAVVPEGWTGHPAYFSELFYTSDKYGDIRISADILRSLLPKPRKENSAAHPRTRQIHKRRSEWLMFIVDLLSAPYCAEDFYRGSLKPTVARDWFVENIQGAPKDAKQYQRDLRAFRHLATGEGKPDQREEAIVLLLRTAADSRRTIVERRGIAKTVSELVLHLKDGAMKNPGRPMNITRGAWQYCRDKTKEYVPVSDVDKFFDDLDERDAQRA